LRAEVFFASDFFLTAVAMIDLLGDQMAGPRGQLSARAD